MALIENLQDIKSIKEEIRTSIENKGVDTTNSTFFDYPELIDSIQAGGGEEYTIEDCNYLFIAGSRLDVIDKWFKYIKPTTAIYMFGATANSSSNATLEQLNYINRIDFTKCTKMNDFLSNTTYNNFPEEIVLNIPSCTTLDSFLKGYAGTKNLKKVILKNSNKVTDWDQCFYTGFNTDSDERNKKIEEIELDMSGCTSCNNIFNMTSNTYSGCKYLRKIIFTGSFGGSSSTSSLTFNISKLESMTKEGIIEMFESLGTNTNKKTRIIQINANIYSTMNEDELAIATNKGYTITSA